jgi:ABC-type transport system substrate-binding protein
VAHRADRASLTKEPDRGATRAAHAAPGTATSPLVIENKINAGVRNTVLGSLQFYSDLQMYSTGLAQPDPGELMRVFLSSEVASKENKWQGRNITRWRNADYDALYEEAAHETDPVKRAALFIRMNELVIKNVVVIPVVYRPSVAAVANKLHVLLSGWDSYIWDLHDWMPMLEAVENGAVYV